MSSDYLPGEHETAEPWLPEPHRVRAETHCAECGCYVENCRCGEYEDDDLDCTHCGGEGTCEEGCDPLWYDEIHACHACSGSGKRADQTVF